MKNTNRSPFIYPVYIVQVLNQLMEDSVKNRNGILSKRADIVEILYNLLGEIPPSIIRWGTVIIVAIFLILLLVICFMPYPYSNGESILQYIVLNKN